MLGNTPPPEDRGLLRIWRHILGDNLEAQVLVDYSLSRYLDKEKEVILLGVINY